MDIQKIASTDVISKILSILVESYPGKFQTNERTAKIWRLMLEDLDKETLMAATIHLCVIQPTWPPDVATIRKQAALMSNGLLVDRSGEESWAKILQLIANQDVELDELEWKALKQTGKVYDLRISQSHVADRARFIKAFDGIYKKRLSEAVTLPEVAEWVAKQPPGKLIGDKKSVVPEKVLPDDRFPIDNKYTKKDDDYFGKTKKEVLEIKEMVGGILNRAELADEKDEVNYD